MDRRPDRPGETPGILLFHRPLADPYHGASVTCSGLAEVLEQSFPVEVVAPPFRAPDTARKDGPPTAHGAVLRNLLLLAPRLVRSFLADCAARAPARGRLVVAFGAWVAAPAAFWARFRNYALVYYPQDFLPEIARRWRRAGAPGGRLFDWLLRPLERWALESASLVLVHTESMYEAYRSEGVPTSTLQVYTVPRRLPTLDRGSVEAWTDRLRLRGKLPVVFVGTFEYAPNVRAFEYIRSDLAPKLQASVPEAVLLIVGSGSEAHAGSVPANVRVLGSVADLDGLLYACALGIAPMDTAGGRSNKIIDYALHGLPIVATPGAANGMPGSPQLHLESLERFSDAVMAVLLGMRGTAPPVAGPRPPDPAYVSYMERARSFALGPRVRTLLAESPRPPESS